MTRPRTALILGVAGQDGSYLASFLLEKGYDVLGVDRADAPVRPWRHVALGLVGRIDIRRGDLGIPGVFEQILRESHPDEVYNLAAQSSVSESFNRPVEVLSKDGTAPISYLESIRKHLPVCRFYQASSSEMFGRTAEVPQTEETPFRPLSPYALAKVTGHNAVCMYREVYGLHASNGILYNHESPLRLPSFVTRKITSGLVEACCFSGPAVTLGNLNAKRDWGFAPDFVQGMWSMLQQPKGDDFILATGKAHTVRDFAEACARALDREIEWEGSGANEVGRCRNTGVELVRVSEEWYRPSDPVLLVGAADKAKAFLNWEPAVSFEKLVEIMTKADWNLRAARRSSPA